MGRLTKFDKAKLPEGNIREQGWVSRTFLLPQYAIVTRGRAGKLDAATLRMPSDQATEKVTADFDVAWDKELSEAKAKGRPPSLLRAIVKAFG